MRVARIVTKTGETVNAIQRPDGRLFKAKGCLFEGNLVETDENVEAVRWLPPVDPKVIICLGRNYAAHAAEGGDAPPAYPIVFMKNLSAVTGHEEPIRLPKVCEAEVDYEGEMVVIIGRKACNVKREEALSYVMGYTVGHDVSARIWQSDKGGSQWCRGKSFDTFAPMGPVLVTADEIPNPSGLDIRTTLNGEEVQHSNTSKMIFDVPTLIEFLTQDTTLFPGTAIMTGTPEGVGWARTPKLVMKPGDCAVVEIQGIGALSNPVVAA